MENNDLDAFKAASEGVTSARKETSVEKAFVRWCKQVGVPQKKLQDGSGWPDRTIFLGQGRFTCIEFKTARRKGVLSPTQQKCHQEMAERGDSVLVTSDLNEAISWVLEKCGILTNTKALPSDSSTGTP